VTDSIGSLRCEVVSSLLLREVCPADVAVDGKGTEEMCGNELFICRVVSVENGSGEGKEKPLMYWRQRYVGV